MIQELRPYPATKNSGVSWLGHVPDHWTVSRLKGRLLQNDSGVWSDDPDPTGTIVLRSTEQTVDGGWRIHNPARIRLSNNQRSAALLQVGDLVVTKSSGSDAHIGKTSVVSADIAAQGCCFSNFIQRLRPDQRTHSMFVWYLLNSPIGREQLVLQSTTTTGLGNLTGTILGECRFAFPPFPEQDAIVRFLDHTDRRIRRYIRAKQKLIKLLEEQKQAITHRIVLRGVEPNVRLKPSGLEWLGDVPRHWDVKPAKYFFREVDERSQTGAEELLSVSHITGVTPRSQKNITMFMAESNVGHKVCRPGDLVINTMWAWMAALGIVKQIGVVSPSYAVYRPQQGSPLLGGYADLLLRTTPYKSEYMCRSTGIRLSRLRLYPEEFLRIRLLCPPVDEQHRVIDVVREETAQARRAIASATNEIELLREYRTRLIADVVTGKFDVRDAAARLPEDVEEPDEGDEVDTEADLEESSDEIDAVAAEAEA